MSRAAALAPRKAALFLFKNQLLSVIMIAIGVESVQKTSDRERNVKSASIAKQNISF